MRTATTFLLAFLLAAPAAHASIQATAAPPVAAPAVAQATPQPAAVPVYGFEIVKTYPHDPSAFTQGLVYRDGVLFESTGRFPSTVRKVRLEDGVVLQRREIAPPTFGEGLTVVDDRVLTLTWQDQKGFVWDAGDLTPKGEFAYDGEGWGLTWDGTRVILSDGQPVLRFLDSATLAETGRVPVTLQGRPLAKINELEWVDGEVFANVWQTDYIARIDPATGVVVGLIDLRGLLPDRTGMDPNDDVLNGIAWDSAGRRLFVTGKNWPSLFEIRLTGPR